MNGAESLIRTLVAGGVEVCFANPGTSEMHLVDAIDRLPGIRPVLGLFEGVCSGAADGYGRMAEKPACTLFHLGPGLGNALANLHNARRAASPLLNIVGDHATYHRRFDAPLTSDVEGVARPMSDWVRSVREAGALAADGAAALAAAKGPPGRVASLIVPADCAWGEAAGQAPIPEAEARPAPDDKAVENAVAVLRAAGREGRRVALFVGAEALRGEALETLGRIAAATGARAICDTFAARIERGAGRPLVERLPYFPEDGAKLLSGLTDMILVGIKAPVTFFAYPGLPSETAPEDCRRHVLVEPGGAVAPALAAVADALDAGGASIRRADLARPGLPSGKLDPAKVAAILAALMPEGAVVSDEGLTASATCFNATMDTPPHSWLTITGGAIGQGMPLSVGLAIACPDRPVVCLHGDGGAMYTVQSLWTQAREGLNVKTIVFSNRRYSILQIELLRLGSQNPGPKAMGMFDLGRPDLDWVSLARGMGVPATRAETAEDMAEQFRSALAEPGPALIEAVV
jgi:acetolactate synthase-1/2/3 large subunit